jgi:hypothetical protein
VPAGSHVTPGWSALASRQAADLLVLSAELSGLASALLRCQKLSAKSSPHHESLT